MEHVLFRFFSPLLGPFLSKIEKKIFSWKIKSHRPTNVDKDIPSINPAVPPTSDLNGSYSLTTIGPFIDCGQATVCHRIKYFCSSKYEPDQK